jgi:hypothetical protein
MKECVRREGNKHILFAHTHTQIEINIKINHLATTIVVCITINHRHFFL